LKLELYNSANIAAPGRLLDRAMGWSRVALPVRFGLFEHPDLGLTLIDTGYGARCYGRGAKKSFLLWLYTQIFRADLQPAGQVQQVLAAKGYTPDDVNTVLVSHLHADHISELQSFTNARFIGSRRAFEVVSKARSLRAALGHGSFLELLPNDYADRLLAIEDLSAIELPLGLGAGWVLVEDQVSIVPLEGHAVGHFGVLWHDSQTLYAVDAHWLLSGIAAAEPLFGMSKSVASDVPAAEQSLDRLRAFQAAGGTIVLCHDPGGCAFDVR
jgi:glyoxylase-like metal-dependent hydrolase (beta-lactamase superfamily II)